MGLDVTSWAFCLEQLPIEYTGDGRDVSPPLEWTPGPQGTATYVVIMDCPDGPRGPWVHWLVWNIHDTRLHENVRKETAVNTALGRMRQGRNTFGQVGYGGPLRLTSYYDTTNKRGGHSDEVEPTRISHEGHGVRAAWTRKSMVL